MLSRFRLELATAGVVFLLGALAVYGALEYEVGWTDDGPQAGYFPFRVGIIIMVVSVLVMVQAFRNAGALRSDVIITREGGLRVLRFGLPIVALVIVSLLLGMYVGMLLYLAVMMRWQGRHSWFATILVPVLYTLATWVVFENWFLVPLLKGPIEVWLGLA
ncbi:tripartite tricarboxylate transporter TctB family protein [Roseomonas elaeocarpi]|uniref:Tripartite tricarboxylate transporter TctB family protein n=1 Tax=Roseomonas elaeocarpi TaxID=907779 RepID=A0ABV6JPN9_9PROT